MKNILYKYKYEILLFGLLQHLFMGMILPDLAIYTKVFWPINMFLLGLASYGVFHGKSKIRIRLWRFLVYLICALPLLASYIGVSKWSMLFLSISYTLFFVLVFYEVIKFLIRPSYINKDIISASACGYLLLIEIATFIHQSIYYFSPNAYSGISTIDPAATYIDFIYFSTVTITSIGFGDILPSAHYSKLFTSIVGIAGQFYSVVLVGILISKFTSHQNK
jgi:hypothetical protein